MKLYQNKVYIDDLDTAINSVIGFDMLKNKSILVTGATGLIGSFIVDMLMRANETLGLKITVYAIGRSIDRLAERFFEIKNEYLVLVQHDVNNDIEFDYKTDFIIHAAGNAYPAAFNLDPVGTIMGNILGTKKLLDYGKNHNTKRLLFVSSGEIYGLGDLTLEAFEESYSGYLDPLQPRSCYPASKRTAETLCTSYTKQYGLETVIVRPCHTYGPNITKNDNRANVQFVNNVLDGNDIILKSSGEQLRSYCYIADCASAIMSVLLSGNICDAYNIAYSASRVTIAEFANIVAQEAGRKVIFKKPDEINLAEASPILKQVLSSVKLESLGWKGKFSIQEGIQHTISILSKD